MWVCETTVPADHRSRGPPGASDSSVRPPSAPRLGQGWSEGLGASAGLGGGRWQAQGMRRVSVRPSGAALRCCAARAASPMAPAPRKQLGHLQPRCRQEGRHGLCSALPQPRSDLHRLVRRAGAARAGAEQWAEVNVGSRPGWGRAAPGAAYCAGPTLRIMPCLPNLVHDYDFLRL